MQLPAVQQDSHQHDHQEGDEWQSQRGAQLVEEAKPVADYAFGGYDRESFYEEQVDGLDQCCKRFGPTYLGERAERREALHEAERDLEDG